MTQTVYEKHQVTGGMNVIATGFVKYNVLNQARKPKANAFNPDPKPEFDIELTEWSLKGDPQLVGALQETAYGDNNSKISFRSKSPFAPVIFGSDKQKATGDQLIPEGKALKEGTPVKVHIRTFDTRLNVGCGFDAVMLGTPLAQAEVVNAGGVDASVFDLDDSNDATAIDWEK